MSLQAAISFSIDGSAASTLSCLRGSRQRSRCMSTTMRAEDIVTSSDRREQWLLGVQEDAGPGRMARQQAAGEAMDNETVERRPPQCRGLVEAGPLDQYDVGGV